MRILLRHKETGMFWERPERWTDRPELAFDFRFIDRAQHYLEHVNSIEVEVALMWDTPLKVEAVPLERSIRREVILP